MTSSSATSTLTLGDSRKRKHSEISKSETHCTQNTKSKNTNNNDNTTNSNSNSNSNSHPTNPVPIPHEEDESDDLNVPPSKYLKTIKLDKNISYNCPYLDQIDRKSLDFDFEKVCSVSMCNHNVYGCLVCGAYFAGRSKFSPAHFHSLEEDHRIFIHLDTGKIYCLPENYEVINSSLSDIKHNLHAKYTETDIENIDTRVDFSHALNGKDFLPGVIGMNNLSNTDWLNVVIQSLMRVKPLRNYFIRDNIFNVHGNGNGNGHGHDDQSITHTHNNHNMVKHNNNNSAVSALHINMNQKKLLVLRFGELVRKYFNPRNFKGQVSPHELLQAISIESKKRFQIGKKSDPLIFLAWFLNQLHRDLDGNSKHLSSIISQTFQGLVTVTTYTPIKPANKRNNANKSTDITMADESAMDDEYEVTVKNISFFYLLLELPVMPLFKDGQQEKVIPQIPLQELLSKFDGVREEYFPETGIKKTYTFARLPQYLIIAFHRFQENNFFVEKNSTIVGFVLKSLDLKKYLTPMELDINYLNSLSTKKLKKKLKNRMKSFFCRKPTTKKGNKDQNQKQNKNQNRNHGRSNLLLRSKLKEIDTIIEKKELIAQIGKYFPSEKYWMTKYDLVANICHDSDYHSGHNRAFLLNEPNSMWYEMQDLHVDERMPQLVAISEAYIQLWKRKDNR